MRTTVHLKLEGLAQSFYREGYTNKSGTRLNFEFTGTVALTWIILGNGGLKAQAQALPKGKSLSALLVGGIARAGCGLITPKVLRVIHTLLPETQIFTWVIGASRPKDPEKDQANIYFHTLDTMREEIEAINVDWDRAALIATEYGLATASTLEAVVPTIAKALPKLNPANVVFFANCACLEQSGDRIEQAFPDGLLAVGSFWRYSTEAGTRYYLHKMLPPDGIDALPWETLPQDWGKCAFGDGRPEDVSDFLNSLERTVPLTAKQRAQARQHLLKKGRVS